MKNCRLLFIGVIFVTQLYAQQITRQDYARAVSFLMSNLNNKKVFNVNTQFNWFADSSGLSFVSQGPESRQFNKVDLKKMKVEKLFDHERLAKLLTDSLKKEIKPTELPINTVTYVDKTHLEFNAGGNDYLLDLTNYSLSLKKKEESDPMEQKSPDGKWIAYSKDYNLYIKSTTGTQVKQLSREGIKNYEYASWYGWGELIEGENGERPAHFSVSWSPDSKWIQTYICDLRKGQKMYLLHEGPIEPGSRKWLAVPEVSAHMYAGTE